MTKQEFNPKGFRTVSTKGDELLQFYEIRINQMQLSIDELEKENEALKTEISSLKEKSNLPE